MDPYCESAENLDRLRLKIGHLEEEWQEIYENWDDRENIRSVEEDIIPLIISTHAAIEDLTAHLILAFVVKDSFSERAFEYFYSGMSQSHRERLLVNCEILSNQTQGRISNFKGLRNDVAHGTFMQIGWHRDDVPKKMNDAFEVLNKFERAFTDREFIEEIYQGNNKI
ncbi:unknown [Haloarcula marismortui ATCC 43049]|uniref:MAE-28990/MAE-18760-like HEPN domain-containing protein n=1 Tax=Haloarcula marismortui (strain ATCC 43049 / DSM 3752 / JCM 8966 / VKM B-1809) TaxID=272569 RepID=Q5V4F1_HALMA|nr:hypothetical protein [Haloarcula marismortui]AAV45600.1 unknown [Haloarcula marismortui ATCC 43049]QCP90388.1 hypothetical protein E6P14_05760 [Haloarcula marismortui ATCC 43049]